MRVAVLAAAFALIGAGCGKSSLVPPTIPWNDLAHGEALAESMHKPAFIFFFAEWSTADKELDERVFTRPAVRAEMQSFIPIRVDVSDDDLPGVNEAKDRFRVLGVPTMLVVKSFDDYPNRHWPAEQSATDELFRANEFMDAEHLVPKHCVAAKDDYDEFIAERRRAE